MMNHPYSEHQKVCDRCAGHGKVSVAVTEIEHELLCDYCAEIVRAETAPEAITTGITDQVRTVMRIVWGVDRDEDAGSIMPLRAQQVIDAIAPASAVVGEVETAPLATGARCDLTEIDTELSALGWTTDVRLRCVGDDRAGYLNAESINDDERDYVLQIRDDCTGYIACTAGGGWSKSIDLSGQIMQTFAVLARHCVLAPAGAVVGEAERAAIDRSIEMHTVARNNYVWRSVDHNTACKAEAAGRDPYKSELALWERQAADRWARDHPQFDADLATLTALLGRTGEGDGGG